MKLLRNVGRLKRLLQIIHMARKYALLEILLDRKIFLLGGSRAGRKLSRGLRLRLAMEELGPVFVKFGQAMSTRRDLLPDDIAEELIKLQDQVPPFPNDEALAEIERGLGKPVTEVFDDFESAPLASASIAQVHAATLKPQNEGEAGLAVVVKVLRPKVEQQIQRDISLMFMLAELVEWVWAEGHRLKPVEVVKEYEKVIFDELDLVREAANASQLRSNWLGSDLIYHPAVFFDYTSRNVLVMERVYGHNIDEIEALKEEGVNFQVLAERGVEIFFKQVFRDNFFHADMHPGNIFVDSSNPEKPRYIALDFGIVGSLTPSDQRYLAENFLAFFNRDYRRIAELHLESGWVPDTTRIDEFESAIRSVSEPIFQRPLKDISFGLFLMRLFQTARRFNMIVQPQLVLLQKTLLNIEGLGRQLYPDLDLWKTAKPIMEDWMKDRLSPLTTFERFRDRIPSLAETLPELAHHALLRMQNGNWPGDDKAIRQSIKELQDELVRERRAQRLTLMGAGLGIVAALFWMNAVVQIEVSVGIALLGAWCWYRAWRQ